MLFNSQSFAVFFLIIFFLYWFAFNRNFKLQNLLLLTGSYVFYCFWDWRFLSLLIFTSALNYALGYAIGKSDSLKTKRIFLNTGVVISIGLLIYFKYVNFFISSFVSLFSQFSISLSIHTANIILPLGISFFTFRTLNYLFDIYRGKIEPTTDWLTFFTFVAFFPSLISGPIDKASMLIPQLERKRVFNTDNAVDGLRQILWGLFKKTVIADNCAVITDQVFSNYHTLPASTLLISIFLYTVQIYTDFSGYSDMAIGLARLLGLNITRNFDFPFFAQNIGEFWRKWHISLTTWLIDYVFTPLSISFRDYGKAGLVVAIIINFTLIGIWHGASWTFVLFGFLHGCYYIPLIISGKLNKKKKIAKGKIIPSFSEFINIAGTFLLVMFTFVIFRSDSISQAFDIYKSLFSKGLFSAPVFAATNVVEHTFIFILFLFIIEWFGKDGQYALADIGTKWPAILRWSFY
ncbi:MAG TPA: MBOAT family O-acyltransferase, partial [Mucilaginibacter sp.]